MGSSVIATCAACGYESDLLLIGGGMENFEHFLAFPAYCAEGDHLLTVNLFDTPPRHCPKHRAPATAYDDPSLFGEPRPNFAASRFYGHRTPELADGLYFCPACHRTTLRFSNGGLMWD